MNIYIEMSSWSLQLLKQCIRSLPRICTFFIMPEFVSFQGFRMTDCIVAYRAAQPVGDIVAEHAGAALVYTYFSG